MILSPRVLLHKAGSSLFEIPEGYIALPQLPGTAFGDGSHPTTRLCAGVVDLLCRQQAPERFLDVGTGTGVLARIARARGARFVAGTDIDPSAILAAQANAALDSHPLQIIIVNASPDHWGPIFNLVVANILEDPLRDLAPSLTNALAPGGTLILSGFTRLQIPFLHVAYSSLGLTYVTEAHLEEWALMMFRRSTAIEPAPILAR